MQGGSRKLLQFHLLAEDAADLIALIAVRETLPKLVPEPFWLSLPPWKISEGLGEIKVKDITALHYALYLELAVVYLMPDLYQGVQRVADRFEVFIYCPLGIGSEAD